MQIQNHKTDESKQAQSVYIKNYTSVYTTQPYIIQYCAKI